jgi:hypothetical protein
MGIASAFLLPPSLSELRRTQSLSELRRTRSLFELRRTSRSTHPARYALKTAPPFLGFSKFEFNGIGGLRAHIGIVPICGTSLPVHFGPGLPLAGAVSFLDLEVSAGSAFGARRTYAGTPRSAR